MLTPKAEKLVKNIIKLKGNDIFIQKYKMKGKYIADDLAPDVLYYFFIAYNPINNLYMCAVVFAKDIDESETFEKQIIDRLNFKLKQKGEEK